MDSSDKQISVLENFEFIKIDSDELYLEDIYILLKFVEIKRLNTYRKLRITIIPIDMPSYIYTENRNFKAWAVEVLLPEDLYLGRVKFACDGVFEILPKELRGKGLGSYLLGKFVRWLKQFPPELRVDIHIKSLDNSCPDNAKRVNSLYGKFGLLDAKTIEDIKQAPTSERITSLSMGEFSSSLIRDNARLKDLLIRWEKDYVYLAKKYLFKEKLVQVLITIIFIPIAIFILIHYVL